MRLMIFSVGRDSVEPTKTELNSTAPRSVAPPANVSKFRSGAALMLALWALFLLSALVISWALDIDSRLTLSGNANRALEAEALACSGAEVALHPLIKPNSPNLNRRVPPRGSYEVRITGEGGRLNLNWLLAGEDPTRLEILRKYLELKHIDLNERDRMIDCLLDWVDPDDLVRLNGAEREGDYRPSNTLLTRIEELKRVKGWEQFTSQPGWDDEFTLNSSGTVDISWASRDVLRALPGMTDALVDRFLQMRRGPDGIDGTADDAQFKNIEEVRAALGFSTEQFQELTGLIGLKDPSFRIVSVGKSGDAMRIVQMIVRKAGNIPQLIVWREF
jgi:general secretion pathway protein K